METKAPDTCDVKEMLQDYFSMGLGSRDDFGDNCAVYEELAELGMFRITIRNYNLLNYWMLQLLQVFSCEVFQVLSGNTEGATGCQDVSHIFHQSKTLAG